MKLDRGNFLQFYRRFMGESSGNIAILGALTMPVLIIAAAFAVDQGSLYYERREAQAITDLAAITAAANGAAAEQAALAAYRDNGFEKVYLEEIETEAASAISKGGKIRVEKGKYTPDPSVDVTLRFQKGAEPFDAVRVTLTKTGDLHFGSAIMEPPVISTTSVASAREMAAFSVGSRLTKIDGGILNAVLNGLLGTNLSLSVMDYEALVKADVSVLAFLDALATELKLKAVTYDELLQGSAGVGKLALALSKATTRKEAQAALSRITSGSSQAKEIPLNRLFDLGDLGSLAVGQGDAAFAAHAGIMDILIAGAAIANGGHQVKFDLGASAPGLLDLELDLAIGEQPQRSTWFAIGSAGEIVRTAQTRMRLVAELGGSGVLAGVTIRLPLYLELAYAEARLKQVACATGRTESASVSVAGRPGIADLRIGEVDISQMKRFTTSPQVSVAKLVQTSLINATGSSWLEIGNTSFSTLPFNSIEIRVGTVKTVATKNYAESLTKSLLGNLTIKVHLGALNLTSPELVAKAVADTLGTVTPAVDNVVYTMLSALGLRLGEADIRVTGVKCQRAVLVQ